MTIRRSLREHARATEQDPVNHVENKIIYAWPVKSMTNRQTFGGQVVKYEVVMYEDGFLYCNCAAWQFSTLPKNCKHCRAVIDEAQKLFNEYKRGDFSNFQVLEEQADAPTVGRATRNARPEVTPTPAIDPNIRRRYGRVIEV
jgi:hypothetical protein